MTYSNRTVVDNRTMVEAVVASKCYLIFYSGKDKQAIREIVESIEKDFKERGKGTSKELQQLTRLTEKMIALWDIS